MKCSRSGVFLSLIGLCMTLEISSCRLRKDNDGNTGANSADGTVRLPNYVSCRKDVESVTQRCYQYDGANLNPIVVEYVKATCGRADKGLEGYSYLVGACPTADRLGECVANRPETINSDYYYSPAFSAESAAKACQDADGSWTTP